MPPTEFLEGYDLRPYHFREGQIYEVPLRVADVLVAWEYAEPEMRREDRDQAADKGRRD